MTRSDFRNMSIHYAELLLDLHYTKWGQSIMGLGTFTDILNASIKRGRAERKIKEFENEIKTAYSKLALIMVQIRGHIIYRAEIKIRKGWW